MRPECTIRWTEGGKPVHYINTMAGKAMARKGHASYPDDFQRLRPGENFTAWRVGQDWEIETLLIGEPLLARLRAIEAQDNKEREILNFIFRPCLKNTVSWSK